MVILILIVRILIGLNFRDGSDCGFFFLDILVVEDKKWY